MCSPPSADMPQPHRLASPNATFGFFWLKILSP
jgi:hypothetical protein